MRLLFAAAAALLLSTGASGAATPPPDAVIKDSAQAAQTLVRERRAELAADEQLLYSEVEALMKPAFDIGYSARLVLGRAGRDATPDQRTRFAKALFQALIRKYSHALLDFDQGQVQLLPFSHDGESDRVRVRTVVVLEDGRRVPVDYLMHLTDDGWQAYDVSVEGISYVTNYRNQFAAEIADRGLAAVITRLETLDPEDEITAAEPTEG